MPASSLSRTLPRTKAGRLVLAAVLSVAALLGAGCVGVLEDPDGPRRPDAPTGDPTRDPDLVRRFCDTAPVDVGETPLRRLSREQYANAIRDLTGRALSVEESGVLRGIPDGREGGFTSTTLAVDAETTLSYLTLAEGIGPTVIAREASWSGCIASPNECVRALVADFGRRAFRRPLSSDEVDDYAAMFDELRADLDDDTAAETVVTALLSSPAFLYHAERIDLDRRTGAVAPLDGYAVASRLSFFLWRTIPDAWLLQRAEDGTLDTAEGVEETALAMIADERADATLDSFTQQWLEIDTIEDAGSSDSAWTPALARQMREETLAFVRDVVRNGDGTLETLLTASHSFVSDEVATLYGVTPDADGRVELDPAVRAGLLTQPSFLSRFGAVYPEVHRGRWIRGNLLCDPPSPPPPNVPDAMAAERLSTEPCVGCHDLMDPIGFGFDAYDALGRFHADAAEPFQPPEVRDPSHHLDATLTGRFEGPRELAERLAASEDTQRCVATQMVRYAIGRAETDADACSLVEVGDRWIEEGGSVLQLLVAITTSESFRSRAVREYEAP
ncbi:MAG: DUF1592 domain-containing protein [Sandaracinaceae bacterium]